MAKITDIADAILARLNAGSYGASFTATRSYDPNYKLETLDTLTVTVAIKDRAEVPMARKLRLVTHAIDVAVQKRIDPTDLAECDALVTVCENIVDDFLGTTALGATGCEIISAAVVPVYAPEHMREKRAFTSVITFTARETRTRGA